MRVRVCVGGGFIDVSTVFESFYAELNFKHFSLI